MFKYIINYLLCFIVGLILCSCDAEIGGAADKLSSGFSYRTDGNRAYIVSDNVFKEEIPSLVVEYAFDDSFILVTQKPSKKDYVRVLSSNLESKYNILITADSTNPEYKTGQFEYYRDYFKANSDLYDMLYAKGMSTENNMKDRQISKQVADSLIENSPYYQNIFSRELNYWIISHKERNETEYLPMSKFYGPYSKHDYLEKKAELGIPLELVLKIEKE